MIKQKNEKPLQDFSNETDDGLKLFTNKKYNNLTRFTWESKGINHKSSKNNNKDCPFKCGTCDLLKEYIKSRYEVVNILEDDSKLIFNPFENGGVH